MRALLMLVSGIASAQLIAIIASPLLARLFSASDFGVFAIYAGIVYFLNAFSSLRLDTALLGGHGQEDLQLLNRTSQFVLICMALFAGVIVFAVANLHGGINGFYIWALPLGVVVGGYYNIYVNYSLRVQNIKAVSIGRFMQSSGGVVFQFLLGLYGFGVVGLVSGQIMGLVLGVLGIALLTKSFVVPDFSNSTVRVMLSTVARHKNYAVYDSLAAAASVAANHLPIILITTILGPLFGGYFYMAARIMILPVGIVGVSLSQYVGSKFNIWHADGNFSQRIHALLSALVLVTVIPFLMVGLVSEFVFGFVLGDGWKSAGQIAGWCGLWMGLKFIYDSLSVSLSLASHQKVGMYFQGCLLLSRVIAILWGSAFLAPMDVLKLFCVVSFIGYFWGVSVIYSINNMKYSWVWLLGKIALSFIIVAPLYWVVYFSGLLGVEFWSLLAGCTVIVLVVWVIFGMKALAGVRGLLEETVNNE